MNRYKLLFLSIFAVFSLSCEALWNVNNGIDITFNINTEDLVKELLGGDARSALSFKEGSASVSLIDASDESIIETLQVPIIRSEDGQRTWVTFPDLDLVGKTVYAEAILEAGILEFSGLSEKTRIKSGSNYLFIDLEGRIAEIYVNSDGDGDGLSPSEPIGISDNDGFDKARNLIVEGVMRVVDTINVSGNTTWNGNGIILKRGEDHDGSLIEIGSSSMLTLSNISIDGQGGVDADIDGDGVIDIYGEGSINSSESLINVNEGTLVLNAGGVLQNNNITGGSGKGGAVTVRGSSSALELEGGKIMGNISSSGAGGIYAIDPGNRVTINSGEVSGNTGKYGGIYSGDGNLTISGGLIKSNESTANGGGIYIEGGSFFEITAGEISYNRARNSAGGIYFSSGNYEIEGGSISFNVAGELGSEDGRAGGIYFGGNGDLTISGGSILNNKIYGYPYFGAGCYHSITSNVYDPDDRVMSNFAIAVSGVETESNISKDY